MNQQVHHKRNHLTSVDAGKSRGFTLIELLIASALGGLVIAAIGSIIISQIRQNIGFQLRQRLVEDWGRVASFIESELFLAERIYPVDGDITGTSIKTKAGIDKVCDFNPDTIKLSMVLNDSSTYITYAVTPIQDSEKELWSGPFVLRRCGPLLTTLGGKGELSGTLKDSIVIGDLADGTALSAQRGVNTLGEATASRDVSVTLKINRSTINHTGTFGGQARVSPSYNLLNDEANTSSSCGSPSTTALLCGSNTTLEFTATNCPAYNNGDYSGVNRQSLAPQFNCDVSRVHQFKPNHPGTTIIKGSEESSREDTIYMERPVSAYKALSSSTCTTKLCVIESLDGTTAITIHNGEVLVFLDKEIRL